MNRKARPAPLAPKDLTPAAPPDREEPELPTDAEAEQAIHTLLRYIGEDPGREGLVDTPKRVLKAWRDLYGGYRSDPAKALRRTFEDVAGYDEIVLVRGVTFHSHCEHHMIPMTGSVDIAYLPHGRVVGLSKLAEVVDGFARRLQTQESLTAEIADAIVFGLRPKGVAVFVRARHHCMVARGVRQPDSETFTETLRGEFRDNPEQAARLHRLIERAGGSH